MRGVAPTTETRQKRSLRRITNASRTDLTKRTDAEAKDSHDTESDSCSKSDLSSGVRVRHKPKHNKVADTRENTDSSSSNSKTGIATQLFCLFFLFVFVFFPPVVLSFKSTTTAEHFADVLKITKNHHQILKYGLLSEKKKSTLLRQTSASLAKRSDKVLRKALSSEEVGTQEQIEEEQEITVQYRYNSG